MSLSQGTNEPTNRTALFGVVLLTLALIPVGLQAAETNASIAQQAPIAAEQLGGTLLTIQPSIRFDSATIRVIGPDGFVLRERLEKMAPLP